MTRRNPNVLIVIVDAFDWNVFNEFQQDLPFLSTLKKGSLMGELTPPPVLLTPVCLGEFYSGQENHWKDTENTFSLLANVALTDYEHTIFDDLELLYDVGIFDLPCLGKLRHIGKFWLAGITGDSHANYNAKTRILPRDLYSVIEEYPIYCEEYWAVGDITKTQDYFQAEFKRLEIMKELLSKSPCNMFVTYIRTLDSACHRWKDQTKADEDITLRGIYKFIDQWIQRLTIEVFNPDIVLVFSDHGFDPRIKRGKDWKSHTPHGMYILYGTDKVGRADKRIYQLHWLLKEVCGFGKDQEKMIGDLKKRIKGVKNDEELVMERLRALGYF